MQSVFYCIAQMGRKHGLLLALYVLGGLWLVQDLNLVPGLHADEAWFFVRSNAGEATKGMNDYTSGLYLHVLQAFFNLFDQELTQLRLVGVLANLLALIFALRLLHVLYPKPGFGLYFCVFLLSSPAFVIMSRMAFELTALVPVLLWSGFFYVVSGWQYQNQKFAWRLVLGGMLLGVACNTHLLALSVCVSVGCACLVVYRLTLIRGRSLLFVFLGFFVGFGPRLWALLMGQRSGKIIDIVVGQWYEVGFYQDLLSIPLILGDVLDGRLLYLRTVGGLAFPVISTPAMLLAFLFWFLWRNRSTLSFSGQDAVLVLTFLLLPFAMRSMAGHTSIRYFVFAAHLFPLAVVVLLNGMGFFNARAIVGEKLLQGVCVICVVLNVFSVQENYFSAHKESGGAHLLFPLGPALRETSSHFTNTRQLYDALISSGAKKVASHYFISESLKAHDLKAQRLNITEDKMYALPQTPLSAEDLDTHYIYYNTPMPGWPIWQDVAKKKIVRLEGLTLRRLSLGEPLFLVFVPFDEGLARKK